jgi:hypothetical protein
MLGSKRNNQLAVNDSQCTPRHDQAACGARESPEEAAAALAALGMYD